MKQVTDLRIDGMVALPTPAALAREVPRTEAQAELVAQARQQIHAIIHRQDPRLLVVVGPCSIHDLGGGREYAARLAALATELGDRLLIAMRVYFEKPRTSTGWKGLIMDPHLNDTCDIPEGLRQARGFLAEVLDLGLPTATELLDPITPQYIADSLCWAAIGARTVESQTHRQMASGLSMPIGFKNSTSGELITAANAITAAGQRQTFLGINEDGLAAAVTTSGNPDCHLILRGGASGPNFDSTHVGRATAMLQGRGLTASVMVDASHGNSGKDAERQAVVLDDVLAQVSAGNRHLIGVMLESNLAAGSQPFPVPREALRYGVSITDACIGWDTTQRLLRRAHGALAARF